MSHAIAALHAAEVALADHEAPVPEMARRWGTSGIVDEMHLAAELPTLHDVAKLDRGLEQTGLRRIDEMVTAGDRYEPRAGRGIGQRRRDTQMREQSARAAGDQLDSGA